jgi:beta-lactamase regulating signal transducer with metallopeptidase domain
MTESSALWMIADQIVKATAILGVAWIATRMLRGRRAALRHLVWVAAFVGILAMPVLELVSPVNVPLFGGQPERNLSRVYLPEAAWRNFPRRLAAQHPGLTLSVGMPVVTILDGGEQSTSEPVPPPQPLWPRLFVTILFGGTALGLGRAVIAMLTLSSIRRSRSQPSEMPFEERARLNALSNLRRRWELRVSSSPVVRAAMTWGILRPVVLLPSDAEEWSEQRRCVVLLHELAHVRRFDSLSRLLTLVVGALYWFHPAVWLCARALRAEAEAATDDAVLEVGVPPSTYAAELVRLAADFGRGRRPNFGFGPNPIGVSVMNESKIETRVRAILNPSPAGRRGGATRVEALAIATIAALAILPLAAARPAAQNPAPQNPAPSSDKPAAQNSQMSQDKAAPKAHTSASTKTPASNPPQLFDSAADLARPGLFSEVEELYRHVNAAPGEPGSSDKARAKKRSVDSSRHPGSGKQHSSPRAAKAPANSASVKVRYWQGRSAPEITLTQQSKPSSQPVRQWIYVQPSHTTDEARKQAIDFLVKKVVADGKTNIVFSQEASSATRDEVIEKLGLATKAASNEEPHAINLITVDPAKEALHSTQDPRSAKPSDAAADKSNAEAIINLINQSIQRLYELHAKGKVSDDEIQRVREAIERLHTKKTPPLVQLQGALDDIAVISLSGRSTITSDRMVVQFLNRQERVKQAEIALLAAKKELNHMEKLYAEGYIAKEELDELKAKVETAQVKLDWLKVPAADQAKK